MASPGDTITYTYSGSKETEDISTIDLIEIDYMDGSGGSKGAESDGDTTTSGGHGGRLANFEADVSDYDTLEIWVGGVDEKEGNWGKSEGGDGGGDHSYGGSGGGSTELWTDSTNEFIAAADAGGGGTGRDEVTGVGPYNVGGGGGARGGLSNGEEDQSIQLGDNGGGDGEGGDGGVYGNHPEDGKNGGQTTGIASGGSQNTGGGSGSNTNGEIKLTFKEIPDPPSAPSNLSASSSGDDIDLSWDDVSNEDGYYVYRAQSSGSSMSDYSEIADLGSDTTSYTDYNNEDGERYYYRISAYNLGGESDLSNEAAATTNLPAPTLDSLDSDSSDEVTVTWTDNSNNEDGFEIFRGTNSGSLDSIDTVNPDTTSYTDSGLDSGTKYYYRVESYTEHTSSSSSEESIRIGYNITIDSEQVAEITMDAEQISEDTIDGDTV